MGVVVWEPKAGDIVYETYIVGIVGRILEVVEKRDPANKVFFDRVRVRWLRMHPRRGVIEETRSTNGLMDFNALITDHERKLARHQHTRQRVLDEILVP